MRSRRQPKRPAPPGTPNRRTSPRPKRRKSNTENARQNETINQPVRYVGKISGKIKESEIGIIYSLNESLDYVALVEQHLQDEAYAIRLQAEENQMARGAGPSQAVQGESKKYQGVCPKKKK